MGGGQFKEQTVEHTNNSGISELPDNTQGLSLNGNVACAIITFGWQKPPGVSPRLPPGGHHKMHQSAK